MASPVELSLRGIGQRAERVANWYFRLNGFLSIPGLVVHLDDRLAHHTADGHPDIIMRTDADLLAVRFPYSAEIINSRELTDGFTAATISPDNASKVLFVIVEVKAGECNMNGPWTDPSKRNMQRVIRRLGFSNEAEVIEKVAASLYESARWVGKNVIVQYVCVGAKKNDRLSEEYPQLVQVTWREVGVFLFDRFLLHPEKTPSGKVHAGWPDFGQQFGGWFSTVGKRGNHDGAIGAVERYIQFGRCGS